MKTLADIKRRMKVGAKLDIHSHRHPEMDRQVRVVSADAKRFVTRIPEEIRKREDIKAKTSYIDYPKVKQMIIQEDEFTITNEDGERVVTVRFL